MSSERHVYSCAECGGVTEVACADDVALRASHRALVEAAVHWSVCDYPEEVRFRCKGCVAAEFALAKARTLEADDAEKGDEDS